MANDQNTEEGAKRLDGVLGLFSKEPITQAFLLSCSKTDFVKILQEKGVSGIEELWTARQNYDPILDAQSSITQGERQTLQPPIATGEVGAAGGLAALPLAMLSRGKDPDGYTAKDLENAANQYANKNVSIFLRDSAKRTLALEEKRQLFYDQFASDHPDAADRLSGNQNPRLRTAVDKRNVALANNLKAEAEIYAKNRERVSKLLRKTADHDALTQEYYTRFIQEGGNNRKIVERASSATGNAPFLKALATEDERIRNSIRFRISQSVNQRFIPQKTGAENILPTNTSRVPGSSTRPSLRVPNPFKRLPGVGNLLNPSNVRSLITKRLPWVVGFSAGGAIFLLFFAIIYFGGSTVVGSSPQNGSTETPVGGGTCVTPITPLSDVGKYVKIEYMADSCTLDKTTCNTIKDTTKSSGYRDPVGEHLTSDQINFIYSTFAGPLGSVTYRNLLTNNGKDPIHLYFFEPLASDSVTGGGAYGSGIMAYWGFFELLQINKDQEMAAHLLIHESTHIIQDRNGLLGFSLDKLSGLDGAACYDNEWLKSYAYRTSGTSPTRPGQVCTYPLGTTDADRNAYRPKEAEAEATANNVFYKPGDTHDYNDTKCSVAINYQQACSNTYAWIKQNIFGGDDFHTCTPAGTTSHTFVALGDSLTAWPCDPATFNCVDSNKSPWKSYGFTGNPWPTYLTTDDPNLKLLFNAGYPAQTTAFMLAQEPGVLSANHPDVLFVLGGTNDLKNGGIDEQGTIANLKSIISTAKSGANAVKNVIVLTIPNQCNKANGNLNTAIKGLSALAPVIDISNTSSPSLGLTCADFQSDGLHLTGTGAQKVADYIDGQIKSAGLLPTPGQMPSKVFYCQGDPKWKDQAYDHGTIGGTGCSVTSMAMILSSYGGKTYTPSDVATIFHNNKWDWPGSSKLGTNNWLISSSWLNSIGFQSESNILDVCTVYTNCNGDLSLSTDQLKLIKKDTDAGWLMLAAVNGKNLPTPVDGGHTIVIETADPIKGTVTIRDPYDNRCAGQDITINANSIGWWLITPIKMSPPK